MERLTEFWKGIYILSEQARKDGYDNYSAYSKLAAYEDTGITPDGIEDIKACLDVNGDGHSGADTLDDLLELMQYRKTGLTPKQIKEIDKLYLEKFQEVNNLKNENRWIPVEERLPDLEEKTRDIMDLGSLAVIGTETYMASDLVNVTVCDLDTEEIFACDDCLVDGKWSNFAGEKFKVIAWKTLNPYKPHDTDTGRVEAAKQIGFLK